MEATQDTAKIVIGTPTPVPEAFDEVVNAAAAYLAGYGYFAVCISAVRYDPTEEKPNGCTTDSIVGAVDDLSGKGQLAFLDDVALHVLQAREKLAAKLADKQAKTEVA